MGTYKVKKNEQPSPLPKRLCLWEKGRRCANGNVSEIDSFVARRCKKVARFSLFFSTGCLRENKE